MAELPSAFLVTSQASSSPTGNKDKEQTPMIVITTNNPASFLGLTVPMSWYRIARIISVPAQIKDSQAAARHGVNIFVVKANLYVKTWSKSGAVRIAATMPVNNKQAPMKPLVSAE